MRRSFLIVPLLLATLIAPACEDGTPWGTDTSAPEQPRHDFGPTAVYGRRLIFMGPGERLPTAAIFDFTTLSDSVSVRRGVRARVLLDEEWKPLVDTGWTMEPMRDPWRVVPGGDLGIVVNDAGEFSALTYRGEPDVRLQRGSLLAESSPDAGTQFLLRQASLTVAGETVRGILLDSQLGRAVDPAALPPTEGAAPDVSATSDESEPATPIARAGAEAFLVNNSGYYAVFANSADGEVAWVSYAGTSDLQRGGVLEPTAWSEPDEDGIAMPTQWRIGGQGRLTGELSGVVTDGIPLTDQREMSALGYTLVSGWIGDDGVRRDVFGLVRHIQ